MTKAELRRRKRDHMRRVRAEARAQGKLGHDTKLYGAEWQRVQRMFLGEPCGTASTTSK